MVDLAPKRIRFAEEYLKDMNSTQAALRAGYAKGSAHTTGAMLLKNPNVADLIAERMAARSQATGIDAAWVLQQLAEMFTADLADAIDPKTGKYLPIHQWPPVLRRMLNGIDVVQFTNMPGEVVKVKLIDRLRALDLIGKHINVQAFKEQHEHKGNITVVINPEDAEL